MSLTEIAKRARFIKPGFVPLFAVILAVFLVAGYGAANVHIYIGPHMYSGALISGVLVGLLSCGAYSCVKSAGLLAQFANDALSRRGTQ